MSSILDKPLHTFLGEAQDADLPAASQAFVARTAALAALIARQAGTAAVTEALAMGPHEAFVAALVHLLGSFGVPASPEAQVRAQGRIALAQIIERNGGVWRSDEAQRHLGVSRETLREWRSAGKVLALPVEGGTFVYPVAQFVTQGHLARPRPHPAIADAVRILGATQPVEMIVYTLGTRRYPYADKDGGEPRTGFEALRAGDTERVLEHLKRLVMPDNGDATREVTGHTEPTVRPPHAPERVDSDMRERLHDSLTAAFNRAGLVRHAEEAPGDAAERAARIAVLGAHVFGPDLEAAPDVEAAMEVLKTALNAEEAEAQAAIAMANAAGVRTLQEPRAGRGTRRSTGERSQATSRPSKSEARKLARSGLIPTPPESTSTTKEGSRRQQRSEGAAGEQPVPQPPASAETAKRRTTRMRRND
jgi:hypothetical protein